MTNTDGNANMTLLDVQCYAAVPSHYFGQDGSHGFVTNLDHTIQWTNHGGGFDDRKKTLAGSSQMYWEWSTNFVPTTNVDKCGVDFGVNGVCHTLANREMLLTQDGPSMKGTFMDYPIVVFFGKYGLGINRLKELLKSSYDTTMASYADPYNAYNKVIARLEPDAFLDDELDAWIEMAKAWGLKVDEIMSKPLASRTYAKMRIHTLVNEREAIYQKYLDGQITSTGDMQRQIVERVRVNMNNCMDFLVQIDYMTQAEKDSCTTTMNTYLTSLIGHLRAERAYFRTHGHMQMEAAYIAQLQNV
jgi:hypothetical protein